MEKNYKIEKFVPSTEWQREAKSSLFGTIRELSNEYQNLKNEYNRFAKIRNTAAEIPDEYLRGVHLDKQLGTDDLRRLIVAGSDKFMSDISSRMIDIEYYLSGADDLFKASKEQQAIKGK